MSAYSPDAPPIDPRRVEPIVRRIHRLLAGQPAQLQSGVLADLLAIWLAGHIVLGDPAETDRLRKELLDEHLRMVRELLPVNHEIIHGKRPA